MKSEIKEKWVVALRSGDYKQIQGQLRRSDGFCCLGVLCDIVEPEAWKIGVDPIVPNNELPVPFYMHHGRVGMPSCPIRESVGLSTQAECQTLSDMNDAQNLSFEEIATYIEHNL